MDETLVEFLRNGVLGPLEIGLDASSVQDELGQCDDVMYFKRGEIWKYGALEIGFSKEPEGEMQVNSLSVSFSEHESLPEQFQWQGWCPQIDCSLQQFVVKLSYYSLDNEYSIKSDPNTHLVMRSGVRVTFTDDKLHSIRYSPPRRPQRRQVTLFIDQNDYFVAEAASVSSGKSIGNLLSQWVHNQAVNTPYHNVIAAYLNVSEGHSPDFVIADPNINATYLRECRRLQLREEDGELNRMLLNARKAGFLTGTKTTRKYRIHPEKLEEFQFWIEIIYMSIRNRTDVSIDDVLCEPTIGSEFQKACEKLGLQTTELENRWALLGVRKQSKHREEVENEEDLCQVGELSHELVDALPENEGLCLIQSDDQSLFIGETVNLKRRVALHMEVVGPKAIPDWISMLKSPAVISIREMPKSTRAERIAAKMSACDTYHPDFNYQPS